MRRERKELFAGVVGVLLVIGVLLISFSGCSTYGQNPRDCYAFGYPNYVHLNSLPNRYACVRFVNGTEEVVPLEDLLDGH